MRGRVLDLMYVVTSCVLFDVVRALRRRTACGLKTADGRARMSFFLNSRTQTHHRAISGNFCSATLPKFLLYELRITGKAQRAL